MSSPSDSHVALRKYPYPYKAMLAIASDLDETPDIGTYFEICRFLNTDEETAIGKGVGLEVGNTLYFDMPEGQLSYWSVSEEDRKRLRTLIRSGHIDCFHSFGDLANSRTKIQRSLDELESHDCQLRVWIDHAVAPSNFGADIMRGSGDVPGSDAFHADLTFAHGVEYVWMGRVTSVLGQNVPKSHRGIFDVRTPVASLRTLLKEVSKGVLSLRRRSQYRLHKDNLLMQEAKLRSGHLVQQFMRCNPHPAGVSAGDRGDRFFEALSSASLDRLTQREGVSIIYTHLGKIADCPTIFPARTVNAFRDISARARTGEILVATTARVLDYVRHLNDLQWTYRTNAGFLEIDVNTTGAVPEGLSFDYQSDLPVRIRVNGERKENLATWAAADGAPAAVSLPWTPLSYPL